LKTVSILGSPIAPFYSERLYLDLNAVTGCNLEDSVHLNRFPEINHGLINSELEERMHIAQKLSSMVLSLRRKVNLKVRQPLQRIMVPLDDAQQIESLMAVAVIIKTEVNVKEIEILTTGAGLIVKKARANFKVLGSRLGKQMKEVAEIVLNLDQETISLYEANGELEIQISTGLISLQAGDIEITTQDVPGWEVASEDNWTVALDVTITPELRNEGIARELINRIQNIRKESGFDVTDKIRIELGLNESLHEAIQIHHSNISNQTLAASIEFVEKAVGNGFREIEIDEIHSTICVSKI
jgi:isoleucyl-tRNA synthetase